MLVFVKRKIMCFFFWRRKYLKGEQVEERTIMKMSRIRGFHVRRVLLKYLEILNWEFLIKDN